jgi:hypothetical protein
VFLRGMPSALHNPAPVLPVRSPATKVELRLPSSLPAQFEVLCHVYAPETEADQLTARRTSCARASNGIIGAAQAGRSRARERDSQPGSRRILSASPCSLRPTVLRCGPSMTGCGTPLLRVGAVRGRGPWDRSVERVFVIHR